MNRWRQGVEWLSRVLGAIITTMGHRGAGQPEPLLGAAEWLLVACARKAQPSGTPGRRAEAATVRALPAPPGNSVSASASAL